jgi:hypothetical protein
MSQATNVRSTTAAHEVRAHLEAHARTIDDLHEKIKAVPGAVTDANRETLRKIIERTKTQLEWLSEDALACIPPNDR